MQQRDKSRQVREIEKKIDNLFRSHKFMQLPYSIAVHYLLIIFEESCCQSSLSGQHTPFLDSFTDIAVTEQNKYSLAQSINWTSEINTALDDKYVKDINKDILMTAKDFFDMALSYHGAVSAYTMWNREIAEATLVNDNTVHFKSSDEEARYDFLDYKLNVEREENLINKISRSNDQVMLRAKNIVEGTVKYTREHKISYSTRKINYKEIISTASLMIKGHTIPPYNWQFYNLTVEYFKKFWSALIAICWCHWFAFFYATKNFRIHNGITPSSIIVRVRSVWINQLSKWTGLST